MNIFRKCKKTQKTTNFLFFWLSTVIFEPVDDWFMVALWKLDSGCPEERFEEKTLLNNFLIFFERSGKYFQQSFQNCFQCAQSSFLSRTSVKIKFLHPFITLSPRKKSISSISLARLQKRHSTCKKEKFEGKSFLCEETIFFINLRSSAKSFGFMAAKIR